MHIGGRTLARSQALQLLFQAEANFRTVEDLLAGDYVLSEGPLDDFARELALGVDARRHDLDAIIATRSERWALGRLNGVDRNLLRIALFEMLSEDGVDAPIAIDECVELAKAYGTDESSRFVNGLLGRVSDDIDAGVDVVAKAQAIMAERAREEEARRAEEEARRAAEEEARRAEGVDDGYDDGYDDYGYNDGYGYDDEPEPESGDADASEAEDA